MQKYANKRTKRKNHIEIKRVLQRKDDKMKFVIVPKNSDIEVGDYVKIEKILGVENATN